jgi:hypothetical protein
MESSSIKKTPSPNIKPTIGRSEKIGLPQFGLSNVDAKVDTGAYTSSLHCSLIDVVEKDGEKKLKVIPLRYTDMSYTGESFLYPYTAKRKVKNSFGKVEERYVIKTSVYIFGREIKTEFSLTDRTNMKFPILLGRKFLKKNFVVDVSLKDRSVKSEMKASQKKTE